MSRPGPSLRQITLALQGAQAVLLGCIVAALCWLAAETRDLRRAVEYLPETDTQQIAAELDRANDRLEERDRAQINRELADPLRLFR